MATDQDILEKLRHLKEVLDARGTGALGETVAWVVPLLAALEPWAAGAHPAEAERLAADRAALTGMSRSGGDDAEARSALERLRVLAGELVTRVENVQPEEDAGEPDAEILDEFVTESTERLNESDGHLLTLENDPSDEEALNAVFRCFHTIKGLAGFLNLKQIERLAHAAEDILDQARTGKRTFAGRAVDVVFDAIDELKRLVAGVASGGARTTSVVTATLIERLRAVGEGREEPSLPPGYSPPSSRRYSDDAQPASLLSEGIVRAAAAAKQAADVGEREPTDKARARDSARSLARALESLAASPSISPPSTSPAPASRGTGAPPRSVRERLIGPDPVLAKAGAAAMAGPAQAEPGPAAKTDVHVPRETIRVDAERLDQLVDMIGELVITESMVRRAVTDDTERRLLARLIARMDKITREVQEIAGSLRMVPLRGTFQKMARVARDVAKKAGRRIEFRLVGEDTELDKTVVERLGDPLVHLVRNAIDHGIEPDERQRTAQGKPAFGHVELRAFHQGGRIHVEIADDGRGLDRERIIAKAIERGLLRDAEGHSNRDVFRLICEPGFSTAAKVTELSGRGVGMDVVKRQIDAMGGTLEITSEPGRGSCFSMRLPLTLAVIDGMLVQVAGERFIIPVQAVSSLVPEQNTSTVMGAGEVIMLQGQVVPVLHLDSVLGLTQADVSRRLNVIIEVDDRKIALPIDTVLGQQQVVIKSLGDGIGETPGFSGCAILPDGRVGLVLDPAGLVRLGERRQVRVTARRRSAAGEAS